MNKTAPQYLLFTEAKNLADSMTRGGRWRFVLERIGTAFRVEEADDEPGVRGERLQLLAVVRGLEALDQESCVTLITSSKYVGRGIRRGLTQWKQNDWQWERYGQMALIKNHDLWKRIDQAMKIHQINCRVWQFDPPHVRTQVANEADEAELTGRKLPVPVSVSTNSTTISASSSRINLENQGPRFSESALVAPVMAPALPVKIREDGLMVEESLGRGNHLTLNLNQGRAIGKTNLVPVSRVSSQLADKVKPIGHGKAFGYALAAQ